MTCCDLDDLNFESWEEQEILLFTKMSRPHPPGFVTMLTRVYLCSVSLATWIQSTLFHHICVRSVLILCFQLWLLLPLGLPIFMSSDHNTLHVLSFPSILHAVLISSSMCSSQCCMVQCTDHDTLFHAFFSKLSPQCPVLGRFNAVKSDQVCIIIGFYVAILCRK